LSSKTCWTSTSIRGLEKDALANVPGVGAALGGLETTGTAEAGEEARGNGFGVELAGAAHEIDSRTRTAGPKEASGNKAP